MRTTQNSEANECFEPKRPAELQVQAAKNGFSELGSRQGGKEVLTVDAYSGLKKLGKETELVQSKVCLSTEKWDACEQRPSTAR